MEKKISITQVRSTIGRYAPQKKTVRALGIRKMGQTVEHTDTPAVRGMIERVKHLVEVKEV
jgi:large subunit ribosomal protein L30